MWIHMSGSCKYTFLKMAVLNEDTCILVYQTLLSRLYSNKSDELNVITYKIALPDRIVLIMFMRFHVSESNTNSFSYWSSCYIFSTILLFIFLSTNQPCTAISAEKDEGVCLEVGWRYITYDLYYQPNSPY